MNWNNNSNGPWGGGGNKGPWGTPPRGPGGGDTPPDLEDVIRKTQEQLKAIFGGGGNGGQGGNGSSFKGPGELRGFAFVLLALVGFWAFSGWYRVNPDELGVELVFGKYVGVKGPGLNYNWPTPFGEVLKPKVTAVNRIDIGMRNIDDGRRVGVRDVPEESLMLTGDENIVDVDFTVFWRVRPDKSQDFLFNIQAPEMTIKAVAESAMREVIGRSDIQPILTGARLTIEAGVQDLMQKMLDSYGAGVEITQVQMQKVDPPSQVIDAFRDVQAARADQERLQNEAQSYANRIVPEARGEASRVIQGAEAYKERAIAEAKGQADRFMSVLTEFEKAPEVTKRRIYIETLEKVLSSSDKIIIDQPKGGQGVVPYLPLDQLNKKSSGATR